MISEVAKQQIWQEKKAVFSQVSFLTIAQWGNKCHEIIFVLIRLFHRFVKGAPMAHNRLILQCWQCTAVWELVGVVWKDI